MRPTLLDPLFAALTTLPGVGPKLEKLYRRLFGREEDARVIDLLFHLPTGTIDRRARPKLRDVVPGTVVTVAVTVDRASAAAAAPPARALSDLRQRRDRRPHRSPIFNAARTTWKSSCRSASCATSPAPPRSTTACCRWCIPTAWSTKPDLAKLPLVEPVYPLTEGLSLNQVRKAVDAALDARAGPAGMAGPELGRARALSAVRRRAARAAPAGRARRRRCRKAWPGRGSPMTNCSPASSRSRWCARICDGRPAAAAPATAHLREKLIAALPYSLTPSQTRARRRHRRRSRQARTHAAAAAGRRRLRQDRGGAARRRGRDRSRPAGRADGADRNPGAPASRHHRAARRGGRHPRRDPDRPRARPRAQRHPRAARAGRHRPPDRHPRAVPGRRRLPRSRARRRRRAAPLRRAPAAGARAQGRGGRHAGDDRDADPAHAGADLFRRHGHLRAAREAGRPPADRHPHHPARPARRGRSTRSAARSPRAAASIGSARWSRNPKTSISPPPRSASPTLQAALRRAWSISCTAA